MAGTLVLTTLSDGTNSTSATNCIQGSAKAWVNFNGSGGASIRASFNVSSVTRNTTGDYTVNFTTAFSDTNYAWAGTSKKDGGVPILYVGQRSSDVFTTTSLQFVCQNDVAQLLDSSIVSVVVFR